jgi:hypothetical protein
LQVIAKERRLGHYLLGHNLDEKREHTYYIFYVSRSKITRQTLASVDAKRGKIEVGFEATEGECGLDPYEVCRWQRLVPSRHAGVASTCGSCCAQRADQKTPEGSMLFSVQEIRGLLRRLMCRTLRSIEHLMLWAFWWHRP